ncbi:MAG: DUF1501 domain-containing protein [Deltaproteobacteria bacterium]|nr:DUF1501 domain-containing protein [Deltaproteobacteria bacterium]
MTKYEQGLLSRRQLVQSCGGMLGALALSHLTRGQAAAAPSKKNKSVICLFQHGGPSQVDLFDPKPVLNKWHGKAFAGDLEVHFDQKRGACLGTPFAFSPYGQSGIELSELLPHTGIIADELTLVRSMTTDSIDHERALRIFHGGKDQPGRPTLGAWMVYGMGSANQNLPAYVVLTDPRGLPVDGPRNWSAGFLPAEYQGTPFRSDGNDPIADIKAPAGVSPAAQHRQLALLDQLNRAHQQRYSQDTDLAARIKSYELAAQMQTSVPEAVDLSDEPSHIRKMYGLDNPATESYAHRCIMARRLIERGVRFVEIFLKGQPWDTHDNNAKLHRSLSAGIDQPSAALVKDLKQRGLLDDTVVLWTGEFGRLPISEAKDGRDHNRHGFSLWAAGGGFKRGHVHGATDDFGYKAVKDPVSVGDFHATLLHTLGMDHTALNYPHEGRADSLTDAAITKARVIDALLL